jgi:hypothetical protein
MECRLERKIDAVVEWALRSKGKVMSAVGRRRQLIRELRFKKRQMEARRIGRQQSHAITM